MTHLTSDSAFNNDNNDNLFSSTMKSIGELLGYDLHTSRVVFEHEGNEVVLVHNMLSGIRRVYINGDEVFDHFSPISTFASNTEIVCNGVHYRIVTRVLNLATMSQDVTLIANGVVAGRTTAPVYGALRGRHFVHALFGLLVVGFSFGFAVSWIL
ncbi:hypothetical protein [Arenicella xantha]|uniref:Uncharacterized protein n=1 Tax=Arenicella xantha TaxID=644221 RepID=A0A395JHH6_9GAMM|nr:hypothetical protein [Arenicella xantha]RBP48905.1 hypothetical protein DFR28_105244 [Arenicella xantha]